MPRLDKTNISCGVYQLDGITGWPPEKLVAEVCKALREQTVMKAYGWTAAHRRPPAIMFSDYSTEGPNGGGAKLAKYIADKHLGSVYETPSFVNTTCTGSSVKIWTWLLDYDALKLQDVAESYK